MHRGLILLALLLLPAGSYAEAFDHGLTFETQTTDAQDCVDSEDDEEEWGDSDEESYAFEPCDPATQTAA
jgi:hypothetical protein